MYFYCYFLWRMFYVVDHLIPENYHKIDAFHNVFQYLLVLELVYKPNRHLN